MKTTEAVAKLAVIPERAPPVSFFEYWPGWLFYAPIVLQWIALGVRHGDFALPALANPRITGGGLCGESKSEILDLLAPPARALVAPYTVFNTSDGIAAADRAAAQAALEYPMVGKPDIGCNGAGVRLLRSRGDLERMLRDYPAGVAVMLQAFIPWEGEAGLFYVRDPAEPHGRITSLTLKSAPMVVGDGRSTLRALVLADPRAGRRPDLYFPRLTDCLDRVPASGERVRLVFAGNHCRGSIFEDGRAHITPALTAAVERVARCIPDFHFGRVDVRFSSLPELHKGAGFSVIEVNGVGSEATHIWDPRETLRGAYAAQFAHYAAAFRIAARNRAAGHRSRGLRALARLWLMQRRLMRSYPLND